MNRGRSPWERRQIRRARHEHSHLTWLLAIPALACATPLLLLWVTR